ncbi:MAG: tol-pal system protein YbgF [Thiotrichales bacterium]|nr:MAG: tol-pal system protein YbgF [Thiotrichales bacterium]
MLNKQSLSFLLITGVLSGIAQAADEQLLSRMSVQQRLERLENIIGSDVLMEQSRQLDALQQEVSMLREMLEEKDYQLDLITQRQRSLYSDMDRRLNSLEGGASRSGVAAPVPPPSTSTSAPAGAAVPAFASTGDKDGTQQYTAAFDLLKEGQYSKSIAAFESFLSSYPESKYADNAQYWLGEANYVSRQYKTALDAFQTLIAKYPESSKISGARLKIGYTYYELKNWSAAKDALMQVVKLYPDTTVASKANDRLERMKREGH